MSALRMKDVAEQLLEKVRRAKLPWVKATNNDIYYVPLPDGMSLSISRLSWLPGPPPGIPELPDLRKVSTYGYRLELFDENGPMIGSLAASAGDHDYTVLREIYEIADGEGDNTQDKLEQALNYLKGIEEPSSSPE